MKSASNPSHAREKKVGFFPLILRPRRGQDLADRAEEFFPAWREKTPPVPPRLPSVGALGRRRQAARPMRDAGQSGSASRDRPVGIAQWRSASRASRRRSPRPPCRAWSAALPGPHLPKPRARCGGCPVPGRPDILFAFARTLMQSAPHMPSTQTPSKLNSHKRQARCGTLPIPTRISRRAYFTSRSPGSARRRSAG